MYIGSSGYVSFDSVDLFHGGIYSFPNGQFTVLDPFWSFINTFVCGEIYFRESIDIVVLSLISTDIKRAFNSSFKATWAFIVMFDGVCKCCWWQDLNGRNNFQLIITTDANNSYAIYNYGRLSWLNDIAGETCALYNAGDGINYYILPGSFYPDLLQVSPLSNVGIKGQWIFNISPPNNIYNE